MVKQMVNVKLRIYLFSQQKSQDRIWDSMRLKIKHHVLDTFWNTDLGRVLDNMNHCIFRQIVKQSREQRNGYRRNENDQF